MSQFDIGRNSDVMPARRTDDAAGVRHPSARQKTELLSSELNTKSTFYSRDLVRKVKRVSPPKLNPSEHVKLILGSNARPIKSPLQDYIDSKPVQDKI